MSLQTHAAHSADYLLGLLAQSEALDYIGEPISQLEHGLQCAHFAKHSGHGETVELATLLHDIGHFCNRVPEPQMDGLGVINHEWIGARVALAHGLPKELAYLIGEHVDAKRYLAGKKASYLNNLSPASLGTLAFQGGPMDESEVAAYEAKPHFKDIIRVRVNDEKGKQLDLETDSLEDYRPRIQRVIEATHQTRNLAQQKTIYFVRHAEATGQAPDAVLTDKGQRDAQALVPYFKEKAIDVVLSSPFLRAQATIAPSVSALGQSTVLDHRLREQHPCADWHAADYARHERRSFYRGRYRAPGGVSQNQLFALIEDTLTEFARSPFLQTAVMVTHGRWLMALRKYLNRNISFTEATDLRRPQVLRLDFDENARPLKLQDCPEASLG